MVRIGIFRGTFLRHETTALEEALGVAYRTPALPTSVVLLCSATRGHLSFLLIAWQTMVILQREGGARKPSLTPLIFILRRYVFRFLHEVLIG